MCFSSVLCVNQRKRSHEYWRDRLSGRLPPQHPWHLPQPLSASVSSDVLSSSPTIEVVGFENGHECATFLCAAWSLLLASYTGSSDVGFGLAVSNANFSGHPAVFPFRNTIPEKISVSQFLELTEKQLREDGEHKAINIQLLRQAHSAREQWYNPELIVEIRNNNDNPMVARKGSILLIHCFRDDKKCQIGASYDPRHIGSDEISRVLFQLKEVIHSMAATRCTKSLLTDIMVINHVDLTQVKQWNFEPTEPVTRTLHSAFEQSAAAVPTRTAVCFLSHQITYHELNNMTNALARHLLDLDLQQPYIPICFEKSVEMVVAAIATLKANKGFIPIDLGQPTERIEHILALTASSLVLVSDESKFSLGSSTQKYTVDMKSILDVSATLKTPLLSASKISHTQPAYLLFTSGSTGTPKGVVVEHSNITTALVHLGQKFGLDTNTRMFQYTSCAFDPSILEIFGTLLHGGCVCIPSEDERLNDIYHAMSRMSVNTAVFVPSVLKALRPEAMPEVKKIIMGGETPTESLINTWKGRHLINAYGPTETCIASIANLKVTETDSPKTIGRPLACRAWIVGPEPHLQLLPIGCVGELVIEGPTVARGYLGLGVTNETRSAFVSAKDVDVEENGHARQRMYRTGDLMRYLPDGRLQFMGRKNRKVKYRGQWLDLTTVDKYLNQCEAIKDCTSEIVEVQGSASLVAFVVLKDTEDDPVCQLLPAAPQREIQTIWDQLYQAMPLSMMPNFLVPVTSFPRQITGKLNSAHLASLFHAADSNAYLAMASKTESIPIRGTGMEEIMRRLWSQVLRLGERTIGVDDNFLHLGGNSIKAIELVDAARGIGVRLNVQVVLRHPILWDMVIAQAKSMRTKPVPVPSSTIERSSTRTQPTVPGADRSTHTVRYPATPIQTMCLTVAHLFPEGVYTRLIYQMAENACLERLEKACRSLIQSNEILRTRFTIPSDTQQAVGIVSVEEKFPRFLYFDTFSKAEAHWKTFKESYLDQSMVEFCFVVSETDKLSHFSFGMHHSQFDAWSVRLLLQQHCDLYNGKIPECGPPFSQFAEHLSRSSVSPAAERFWREKLDGFKPTLMGPGAPVSEFPDGCLKKKITAISTSEYTFAVVLYASWALALRSATQENDVTFFGSVSGRTMSFNRAAEVVGPCINVIPTAVRLQECKTYRDILRAIQGWMLDTIPFEDMPLGEITSRCTSWDSTAPLGSLIQHLDINLEREELLQDETPWRILGLERQVGRCIGVDIYLRSQSLSGEGVELCIQYNGSRINEDTMKSTFKELISNIHKCLNDPSQSLACA